MSCPIWVVTLSQADGLVQLCSRPCPTLLASLSSFARGPSPTSLVAMLCSQPCPISPSALSVPLRCFADCISIPGGFASVPGQCVPGDCFPPLQLNVSPLPGRKPSSWSRSRGRQANASRSGGVSETACNRHAGHYINYEDDSDGMVVYTDWPISVASLPPPRSSNTAVQNVGFNPGLQGPDDPIRITDTGFLSLPPIPNRYWKIWAFPADILLSCPALPCPALALGLLCLALAVAAATCPPPLPLPLPSPALSCPALPCLPACVCACRPGRHSTLPRGSPTASPS